MRNNLLNFLKLIIGLYVIICSILYFSQERLIFLPHKLEKDHKFNFQQDFEELNIRMTDGKFLNGLLFKANNTKGLIFYLHGNAGSLNSWGNVAKTYTNMGYDTFILDYRGYGKSEGEIKNQQQLFKDNQVVYNELKKNYSEENIIILGYSIGTGLAAKLASENKPKHLILQAPYYSLTDIMHQRFSFIPTFVLKYKFETNVYIKNCNMPITIFHGNQDNVIYYDASLKLKAEFKNKIHLITLDKHGHNGITNNIQYIKKIKNLLNE